MPRLGDILGQQIDCEEIFKIVDNVSNLLRNKFVTVHGKFFRNFKIMIYSLKN